MILNHARKRVVAGSVDYLLGRERIMKAQRCSGNPEEVELIDATPFAKKYVRCSVVRDELPRREK